MLRLRVFDPPRLAPYQLKVGNDDGNETRHGPKQDTAQITIKLCDGDGH